MSRLVPYVAVGLVTAVVSVASVEAAKQLVIPRNSVGTTQIRNGAILPADLSRKTVAWLNAGAPTHRARGVTVANGQHGDRVRVSAASVNSEGNLLGQMEYLGGVGPCGSLGPWLKVEATFFDSSGLVVDTGSDVETSPVAGVRYPLEVFGKTGAVRAEAVASVECL